MAEPFRFEQRETPDGTVVADLAGDLDTDAAYHLEQALSSQLEAGVSSLILNFTEVRLMNSTAMGVLLSGVETARKTGGDIKLFGLSPHVRGVLDLVGVSALFEIFASENEARASFGEGQRQ